MKLKKKTRWAHIWGLLAAVFVCILFFPTLVIIESKGENVYFVDGGKLFPDNLKFDCTADWCHPNDTGMYFMAQGIKKVLSQIL